MACKNLTKPTKRPRPPEDLSEPALVEYHRVCDVLEAEGRLDKADPAIIALYAETWVTYRKAAREVAANGAVITWEHNGLTGISPHLRIAKELGRSIRGLLADLQLTPASKSKSKAADKDLDDDPLDF